MLSLRWSRWLAAAAATAVAVPSVASVVSFPAAVVAARAVLACLAALPSFALAAAFVCSMAGPAALLALVDVSAVVPESARASVEAVAESVVGVSWSVVVPGVRGLLRGASAFALSFGGASAPAGLSAAVVSLGFAFGGAFACLAEAVLYPFCVGSKGLCSAVEGGPLSHVGGQSPGSC